MDTKYFNNYFNKDYYIYCSPKYNNNNPKPPFHDDKKMMKIILNLLENKIDIFIETGSYMGKTIFFVGKNFPNIKCYSCELNKSFFEIAHEQVKDLVNVNLMLKPSPSALYDICKYENNLFNKNCLFWLDAHWGSNPIYEEILYITKNFNNFCIFIDDFTVPTDKGFHSDGYNIEKITPYIMNKEKLKFYIPSYPSTDNCCKHNPCGYIVISNIDINVFDYLKEILI